MVFLVWDGRRRWAMDEIAGKPRKTRDVTANKATGWDRTDSRVKISCTRGTPAVDGYREMLLQIRLRGQLPRSSQPWAGDSIWWRRHETPQKAAAKEVVSRSRETPAAGGLHSR